MADPVCGDSLEIERDRAIAERNSAIAERDSAIAERDKAIKAVFLLREVLEAEEDYERRSRGPTGVAFSAERTVRKFRWSALAATDKFIARRKKRRECAHAYGTRGGICYICGREV